MKILLKKSKCRHKNIYSGFIYEADFGHKGKIKLNHYTYLLWYIRKNKLL